jgi:hypothetical protein
MPDTLAASAAIATGMDRCREKRRKKETLQGKDLGKVHTGERTGDGLEVC